VFGLNWTATSLQTYIDDPQNVVLNVDLTSQSFWQLGEFSQDLGNPWVGESNTAPFNQEFFIKFNVAVGGTGGYFTDGVGNKPWSDKSSTAALDFLNAQSTWYPTWDGENSAMQIDWVKVYQ
jgi:hypothetical protein